MAQQLNEWEWDTALNSLNGQRFVRDDAYWWKLRFERTDETPARPHSLRYELTLHDPSNHRIFGYDNAHGVSSGNQFAGRRTEYDHSHKTISDEGTPYDFESFDKLLDDFFNGVDAAIETHKNHRKNFK